MNYAQHFCCAIKFSIKDMNRVDWDGDGEGWCGGIIIFFVNRIDKSQGET